MERHSLSHESLDVYQVALQFTRFSSTFAKALPRGTGSISRWFMVGLTTGIVFTFFDSLFAFRCLVRDEGFLFGIL